MLPRSRGAPRKVLEGSAAAPARPCASVAAARLRVGRPPAPSRSLVDRRRRSWLGIRSSLPRWGLTLPLAAAALQNLPDSRPAENMMGVDCCLLLPQQRTSSRMQRLAYSSSSQHPQSLLYLDPSANLDVVLLTDSFGTCAQ